jgi:hypothetical protein
MVRDKIKLSKLTSDMAKRFIKRNSKDILSNGKDFASGFGVLRLPSIGEINFHSTYGNSQYFDENLW